MVSGNVQCTWHDKQAAVAGVMLLEISRNLKHIETSMLSIDKLCGGSFGGWELLLPWAGRIPLFWKAISIAWFQRAKETWMLIRCQLIFWRSLAQVQRCVARRAFVNSGLKLLCEARLSFFGQISQHCIHPLSSTLHLYCTVRSDSECCILKRLLVVCSKERVCKMLQLEQNVQKCSKVRQWASIFIRCQRARRRLGEHKPRSQAMMDSMSWFS